MVAKTLTTRHVKDFIAITNSGQRRTVEKRVTCVDEGKVFIMINCLLDLNSNFVCCTNL